MTTVQNVLDRVRREVMGRQREPLIQLSGAHSNSVTTLTVTSTTNVPSGSLLEVDLELMVVSAVASATTLTVIRGMYGSTAASHSDLAIVRINPIVSNYDLFQALNEELDDLSSPGCGLFKASHVDLVSTSSVGYDLTGTGTVMEVLRVQWGADDSNWIDVPYTFRRDEITSSFTSGNAIFMKTWVPPSGRTVRVWYAGPFTHVTTASDDILAVTGLHTEAHDLLWIGSAIRIVSAREIGRNFYEVQGDTRRAQEVPSGAQNSAAAGLRLLRQSRLNDEVDRLRRYWEKA